VSSGEGVLGLRRAFQIAGARNLIASLWGVGDQSACTWMRALYGARLAGHRAAADAAREASWTILSRRRSRGLGTHPFYWGGFIAVECTAGLQETTLGSSAPR